MNLTAKYEIYILEDDPEIKKKKQKELFELSKQVRKALNFAYTEQFNYFTAITREKQYPGLYKNMPYSFKAKKKEKIIKGWSKSNIAYKLMNEMEMFQDLPGVIRSTIQQEANKRFNNDIKRILSGEATPSSFKYPCPIYIHKDSVNLNNDDGKYYMMFFPKIYDITFRVLAEKRNYIKVIMDRVLSGEYDIGQSNIKYEKGKWYLRLCFKINEGKIKLDKNKALGVDSGFKNPLVYGIADTPIRGIIGDGDIITKRRIAYKKRWNIVQRSLSHNGKGSCGHGRKRKLMPLKKLEKAFQNFKETQNHQWAKEIINVAIRERCGIIRMEDLSSIAEDKKDSFVGMNWAYYNLMNKIEYKCKKFGIEFQKVKPAETSQRCSKCGHISEENRPKDERGWGYFCCVECGFDRLGEEPRVQKNIADYNAAYNISGINEWRPEAIIK